MPRRKEIATPEWAIELHVPALIEANPNNDLVRDAVEELEADDLNVILAYFYERRTYEWVAAACGLSGRTSGHYRVQKALASLKAILERKGIDDGTYDTDSTTTGSDVGEGRSSTSEGA